MSSPISKKNTMRTHHDVSFVHRWASLRRPVRGRQPRGINASESNESAQPPPDLPRRERSPTRTSTSRARMLTRLPAVLSGHLIRARPTTSTDRSTPKYPSPAPMMVTTRGTRTYSLSVAVLATHGEQYHPRYSALSLSADGTWRYAPYETSATLLSADAALSALNPDPQHSFATMLVYRLCVPPATVAATRPTTRANTSKRRVNHRSTDRSRAQKRMTTVAM